MLIVDLFYRAESLFSRLLILFYRSKYFSLRYLFRNCFIEVRNRRVCLAVFYHVIVSLKFVPVLFISSHSPERGIVIAFLEMKWIYF